MEKNIVTKKNELINVISLFRKYLKYWPLFLISIILCVGLAFVYLKIKNPIYQINANILIKSDDSKGGSLQSAMMKNFSLGGLMGGYP